jgi:hypothetical protein
MGYMAFDDASKRPKALLPQTIIYYLPSLTGQSTSPQTIADYLPLSERANEKAPTFAGA